MTAWLAADWTVELMVLDVNITGVAGIRSAHSINMSATVNTNADNLLPSTMHIAYV